MRHLNYGHLLYFWTVAREGGVARASEVLFLTPQTISGQLKLLEQAVGSKLFERAGRGLELTDVGRLVYKYADEIFSIGAELAEVVRGRLPGVVLNLRVGITDVVPKLVAYQILQTALSLDEPVRLHCEEGKLDDMLGKLALHQLDVVLADRPLPPGMHVRAYNHELGSCGTTFLGPPVLARRVRRGFPGSLAEVPLLLPTESSALRKGIDRWLEEARISATIVGEFEDSALLKAFAQGGAGIMPIATAVESEVRRQYRLSLIGRTDAVVNRFYAISAERRLKHPAVLAITEHARADLFSVPEDGDG